MFGAAKTSLSFDDLIRSERLIGVPLDALRYDDAGRGPKMYAQGEGGDLLEQFIRVIFPISGREKRTAFLPLPYWGPKKPQYTDFKWERFSSRHFDFYTYPTGEILLPEVVRYLEEDHEWKNRIFGVDNRFTRKIPVIFYQTRRDFEQTHIIQGVIPEGLGGVTELLAWKRVTFPFEGERQLLEHVARHEGTHIYQIAKGSRRLPLWFIEGSAETLSMKWDAQAEMAIRDAFIHGFFFHLDDLWQIEGTWLMYKQGNFITNLIWDEYGEEGYRKIFEGATTKNFEDNIKDSLQLTPDQLDAKVFAALAKKYGSFLNTKDLLNTSEKIDSEKSLLSARGPFYLSGGDTGPRNALYINYVSPAGKVTREEIVQDRRYKNESLDYFRRGASLDDYRIIYAIKRSARDVVRIVPYEFNSKKKKFKLGSSKEYSWPEIESLADPVLVDEHRFAFVGYCGGFSNIYLYDISTSKLLPLTEGTAHHYSDLDYSAARNELAYSEEDGPTPARTQYDRNLYTLHLGTKKVKQLTDTLMIHEIQPRFSPDGRFLLYVADEEGTFDLFRYDFHTEDRERITRMRVGALHPQWSDQNTILFNGYEKLLPSIYRSKIPTGREMLDVQLPQGSPNHARLEKDRFVLLPEPTATPTVSPTPSSETFTIADEKAHVQWNGESYGVTAVARRGEGLILVTKHGESESKKVEVDDQSHYFYLHGNELISLASTMVAQKDVDLAVRKKIESQLGGRAWIDGWTSQKNDQVLVLVNNRVAEDPEKYRKKDEVAVLLYTIANGKIEELPEGPLANIAERVMWISFLSDGKIFFASGDSREGPFTLYWFDPLTKKYVELDYHVEAFRISDEQDELVWKKDGTLTRQGVKERDSRDISGLRLYASSLIAFDFLKGGELRVLLADSKNWKAWRIPPRAIRAEEKKIPVSKEIRGMGGAIDRESGDFLLHLRTDSAEAPESLALWKWGDAEIHPLSLPGVHFERPLFRQGWLSVLTYESGSTRPRELFFRDDARSLAGDWRSGEKLSSGEFLIETDRELSLYDPKKKDATLITGEVAGYTVTPSKIFFSAEDDGRFQLQEFDRDRETTRPLTSGRESAIQPAIEGDNVVWSGRTDKGWELRRMKLENSKEIENLELPGYDVVRPERESNSAIAHAYPQPEPPPYEPRTKSDPETSPQTIRGSPARTQFRLQSLTAAAAYDGKDIRYFISAFAENLFSDKGLFINSVFLQDSQYATIGFSDLTNGRSYSFFYNSRDNVTNLGVDFAKDFLLDRYRQVTWYSDFEWQDYGLPTPDTIRFVTPDVQLRSFYLLKTGVAYGYDVTLWDRHGPVTGSRLYLKGEGGFDAGNARLANLDANLDYRLYNRILPRFGFAHRLVAGTSQGDLPNVFLMGGNISFRGVDFDALEGQNYWVFSEDMRVPVFDFIGAKFFDPLDQVLGFFTRYFDVRGGIYGDVGSAWYNGDAIDVLYSIGYFVNIPTIFGLVFRFNQGFAGEKSFGFWLGYDW